MDFLSTHQKDDTTIQTLLIFNPDIVTKEGEDEKKLLYSFSNQTHYSDIANLGLFQTLIGFFSQFSKPLTTVTMEKTKTFLYSPEPSFWISYTISVDVPSLDSVGIQMLKFLCDAFIFLNGSFTKQYNTSSESFTYKLNKFFNSVMNSLNKELLASPGKLEGVQFSSMSKTSMISVINFVNDINSRFKCVTDVSIFNSVQLLHSTLPTPMQSTLFTLFNMIRTGGMEFGSAFDSLRSASDERKIILGVPEKRTKINDLNCPIFVDGVEKRWVVFEYNHFFFHFFLNMTKEESVNAFLVFLNQSMTTLLKTSYQDVFTNNSLVSSIKDSSVKTTYYYINIPTQVKNGTLSVFDTPEYLKMMTYMEDTCKDVKELYMKGDADKWMVRINADNKILTLTMQLNSNSTLAMIYGLKNIMRIKITHN